MIGALCLALAGLGAASSHAAAVRYPVKIVDPAGIAQHELASGDAFHVAYMISDGARETWYVDRRKIGAYRSGASLPGEDLEAALSSDGSRLAVSLMTYDANGAPLGPAVHVNGAPGPLFDEIKKVKYAAADRLWYKGRKGPRWSVVVDQSPGPAFGKEPSDPIFNANGSRFAYVGQYEDGYHLLLDHHPIESWEGDAIYASADWRVRATVTTEPDFDHRFKLGNRTFGHFSLVFQARVSPDGRHAVLVAGADKGQQVYVDGEPAGPPVMLVSDIVYAPNGQPWWVGDDDGGRVTVYRAGVAQGTYYLLFGKPALRFSPGGRAAYLAIAEKNGPLDLYVDGAEVLSKVPYPVQPGALAFDGEDELHWVAQDEGYSVECVSLLGLEESASRCARKARRLHPKGSDE